MSRIDMKIASQAIKQLQQETGLAEKSKELPKALEKIKNLLINLINFLSSDKHSQNKLVISHFADELAKKITDAQPDPVTGLCSVTFYVCNQRVHLVEEPYEKIIRRIFRINQLITIEKNDVFLEKRVESVL
ncbi:MAG: hypothetical protein ACRC5A_07160 [Enterobacteriaceae bacterium]